MRHVRQIADHLVEVGDVELRQRLAAERLDGDRYVLHVLSATLGGDHNFLNLIGARGIRGTCRKSMTQ